MRQANKVKAIGTTLAVIGVVGVGWWAYGRLNAEPSFVCDTTPVVASEGDTLWAIAEAKCKGNIQSVTDNLVDTYGTNIQLGDIIWLPTNQDCLLENRGGEVYDECG